MAGSYGHIVNDDGSLRSPQEVAVALENGGDVYEAIEEMYGMIWILAYALHNSVGGAGQMEHFVEYAQKDYSLGVLRSPTKRPELH